MNIISKYKKALSNEEQQALSFCTGLADDMGIKIYLVGGIVRDILLNRPYNDIDILVEDDAVMFGKILQAKYAQNVNIIEENSKFKTLKLRFEINKRVFDADIASTRSEVYEYPSALPILAETGVPLKKDISRRDFTVNSLAMSLNSRDFCEIYDETGYGIDDLDNGLIRILHNDSFMDDPSRIVRALKYRAKLNFQLENDTAFLQKKCLDSNKYTNDCQERIKKEITETLNLLSPYVFDKFISENIYKLILGEVSKSDVPNGSLICEILKEYGNKIEKENIWLIYLCILFNFAPVELVGKNTAKLLLKKKEQRILTDFFLLQSNFSLLENAKTNYDIYNFFEKYVSEALIASLILCIEPETCEKFHLYFNKLQSTKLSVNGTDIEKFGIEKGVIYKDILNRVFQAKINNNLNTQEEKHFLKEICKRFYI